MELFWEIQPVRFEQLLKAYNEINKNRVMEIDYQNFLLGKYIGIAINSPKNYPRKPFLYEEPKKDVMTVEEMEEMMRKNTIALGGVIKKKKDEK